MASDIRDKFGPNQIPTLNSSRQTADRGTERQRGRLRSAVEFSAARAMLALVGLLPRRGLLRICELLGGLGYAALPGLRRTGLRNLEMAFPAYSDLERRKILRQSFQNLGRGLAVFSEFSKAGIEELRNSFDCVGIENLERAIAKGKGIILFTGHLGSWELCNFAPALLGHPFTFIVRRIDNPAVERLVDRIRSRFGNRSLDKRTGIRQLFRILRSHQTVGILVDVNMIGNEGIFTDFFGIPASTTFMPARLSLSTGATLVPVFAPWDEKKRRYVFQIEPALEFETTDNEQADVQRITAMVTNTVEKYVRQFPSQWLWIHKRWKTRPVGEQDPYSQR
jgi:KDO2-lipid IV(A) lauroyltransferase